MKIQYLILVMCMGCGDPVQSQSDKTKCVETCDKSLEHCVRVLGEDNKIACHQTYNTVCMPSCTRVR
jgi:hypothetical protein